jgi:hypothetical protein
MSDLEDKFAAQLELCRPYGANRPQREYLFPFPCGLTPKTRKPRKWRFDFAWPSHKIAVEIEGGTWGKSRHTTGAGFMADCEKYNAATVHGWLVLRFVVNHVDDGSAARIVTELLTKSRAK